MDELIIGYDVNLGFPEDFTYKISLKIKTYQDITLMIEDISGGKLSMAFLPVGTLPYIHSDYSIVAQATLGAEYLTELTSNFISATELTLAELIKSEIGRVNQYCTTSFWAPLIFCMETLKKCDKLNFINTNGFQDLLFKIANEKVAAGMVWDVISKHNPAAADKVHILGEKAHLPSPIIISTSTQSKELLTQITSFKSTDKSCYFNGFTTANEEAIRSFKEEMQQAGQHFNLNL